MENATYAVVHMTSSALRGRELCIIRIEQGTVRSKGCFKIDQRYVQPGGWQGQSRVPDPPGKDAGPILELIDQAVIVAHNVFPVRTKLNSLFASQGLEFPNPALCTLRLAKKLIPHLLSYELEYLCGVLGILGYDRGDTQAGAESLAMLFQRLLILDENGGLVTGCLKESTPAYRLPSRMAPEVFEKLPRGSGTYRFHDVDGEIIYVGKARNIRKRVASHFYSGTQKERQLCARTSGIDFEITGDELIALLSEADLILRMRPEFNTVQKKIHPAYRIVPATNRKGILYFTVERRPYQHEPTPLFFRKAEALAELEALCKMYDLCPRFAGLRAGKGKCTHPRFPDCRGVCRGDEGIGEYNKRAQKALDSLNSGRDYLICCQGRQRGEQGFVLVLNGVYQGYGYVDASQQITGIRDIVHQLDPKRHTYHTARIIASFLRKYPWKLREVPPANQV